VRTSRFIAEDAEFGQEDTEELSRVLTAYRFVVIRTWLGPAAREAAMGARRAAMKVPVGEAGRSSGRRPARGMFESDADFMAMCRMMRGPGG
jgi:hypothetical protein